MKGPVAVESASAFIDEKIKELGDWRGQSLPSLRLFITSRREVIASLPLMPTSFRLITLLLFLAQ